MTAKEGAFLLAISQLFDLCMRSKCLRNDRRTVRYQRPQQRITWRFHQKPALLWVVTQEVSLLLSPQFRHPGAEADWQPLPSGNQRQHCGCDNAATMMSGSPEGLPPVLAGSRDTREST